MQKAPKFRYGIEILGAFLFASTLSGCIGTTEENDIAKYEGEFGVITATGVDTLSPFSLDWQNRLRLNNVYEALVSTDENFSIEPGLAVSWGLLGDTEWEFYLRKGVKFQDGSEFNADDVLFSFDLAKERDDSELKSIFANIECVEAVDNYKLKIKTISPDPLFLDKIAQIFILNSENYADGEINGTGAYEVVGHDAENTELQAFDGYWGGEVEIEQANFQVIDNSVTRQEIAITNDCQKYAEGREDYKCGVLTSVSLSVLDRLSEDLAKYKFSNLNSTYLVFNNNSSKLKNENLKKALTLALDRTEIGDFGGELSYVANQFFSSGTFGHNPDLQISERNIDEANQLLLQTYDRNFTLDYHPDYELLANYLHDAWKEVGLSLNLHAVESTDELKKRALNGQNDFYIVSWQVENGDAGGFFTSAVHTPDESGEHGQFNWSGYGDENLDLLIENSNVNMLWQDRLEALRGISEFITETKPYGIPLFESKNIYAVDADVDFVPRADGYVILSDISLSN